VRLDQVRIRNFRGLKDIEFNTQAQVTVIVGPNAVGKTSIFEAIRFHKALLIPTSLGESLTVLSNMGAFFAPTQSILLPAILGNVNEKMEIKLSTVVTEEEIKVIERWLPQLAPLHLRNKLAVAPGQQDLALLQYLSSPAGREGLEQATKEMSEAGEALRSNRRLSPTLIIDPKAPTPRGSDVISQELLTGLFQSVLPTHTLLNYFPSDRSMPAGEVNIQIGSAEANAQIQSFTVAPASKYARLKQYLVNQFLAGQENQKQVIDDFQEVFGKLLAGKRLASLRSTPQGTLSVLIQDEGTKAVYDIDYMSSGEKGLLCTFFLMKRSTARGGIVLLDEPELHLNPAVCRQILPFLIETVVKPLDIQVLICTHSPELLAFAHESGDCELLHLVSGSEIAAIHSGDKPQVFDALRRLGAQTMDILFSRGSVFVEGTDDSELLQSGFQERLAGFKISQLRGRTEVEKNIRALQQAEKAGELDSLQCFVFDRDRAPTDLIDTALVKVLQWERYCLENYLLDHDAIFDACKDLKVGAPPANRASLRSILRDLAFDQIRGVVAREVYRELEVDNPGLRPSEVDSASDYETIAAALASRLQKIGTQLGSFKEGDWKQTFVEKCKFLDAEVHEKWDDKWTSECNGKVVLAALFAKLKLSISPLAFKRRIIEEMSRRKVENWRTLDSFFAGKLTPG